MTVRTLQFSGVGTFQYGVEKGFKILHVGCCPNQLRIWIQEPEDPKTRHLDHFLRIHVVEHFLDQRGNTENVLIVPNDWKYVGTIFITGNSRCLHVYQE